MHSYEMRGSEIFRRDGYCGTTVSHFLMTSQEDGTMKVKSIRRCNNEFVLRRKYLGKASIILNYFRETINSSSSTKLMSQKCSKDEKIKTGGCRSSRLANDVIDWDIGSKVWVDMKKISRPEDTEVHIWPMARWMRYRNLKDPWRPATWADFHFSPSK